MTDYEKLLRAGMKWRDTRRAVTVQDGVLEGAPARAFWKACTELEAVVNKLAPVVFGDKIVHPTPLEEALERSVREQNARRMR